MNDTTPCDREEEEADDETIIKHQQEVLSETTEVNDPEL